VRLIWRTVYLVMFISLFIMGTFYSIPVLMSTSFFNKKSNDINTLLLGASKPLITNENKVKIILKHVSVGVRADTLFRISVITAMVERYSTHKVQKKVFFRRPFRLLFLWKKVLTYLLLQYRMYHDESNRQSGVYE